MSYRGVCCSGVKQEPWSTPWCPNGTVKPPTETGKGEHGQFAVIVKSKVTTHRWLTHTLTSSYTLGSPSLMSSDV